MEIRLDDLTGAAIRAFLEDHLRTMHELSPPESVQRLYESFGFTYCQPFGDYVEDPNSVFITRRL